MQTLKILRPIAFLEGISFLIILFVTMPLKYYYDMPQYNQHVGMAHGLLFIAYVVLVLMAKFELKWDNKTTFISLLASIIPFGTFYADKKYFSSNK